MALSSRAGGSMHNRIFLLLVVTLAFFFYTTYVAPTGSPNKEASSEQKAEGDPFGRPFCEADGNCHEAPDIPSPRTAFSAWNEKQYDRWWQVHLSLNQSAADYVKRRSDMARGSSGQLPRPLVLLGDSITESWLGTGMGRPSPRAEGVPAVLRTKLSSSAGFDPLVLAIGGDQTQHLLWRMQNGQFLDGYAKDPASVFVVMIGTNNLGSGELPGPTARGVLAVANYILENSKGKLLLFKLLPRGPGGVRQLCPPRCNSTGGAFQSFLPAINKVNVALEDGVAELRNSYQKRLVLMDCNSQFFLPNKEVDKHLMPDLLHPNALGHEILADCILSNA